MLLLPMWHRTLKRVHRLGPHIFTYTGSTHLLRALRSAAQLRWGLLIKEGYFSPSVTMKQNTQKKVQKYIGKKQSCVSVINW